MTTWRLVWKELFERPGQLATSFLSIVLGIAVIVSIRTITHFSAQAVARELDCLGANVLILPKSATVNNYYTADFAGEEMPEEYVDRIVFSSLQGVDNLSPKLTQAVELGGRQVFLTGILPKNEFAGKPAWSGSGGVFSRPASCGTVDTDTFLASLGMPVDKTAVRRKVVTDLAPDQVLAGAEIAARLGLAQGSAVEIRGKRFAVAQVLPETGTVDDTRIFAHLHTVQALAGKGRVIHVIEMIGCCKEISKGLVDGLNKLLPEAKVVTIQQIAQTQLATNRLMERFSAVFLIVIVAVGAIGIANYMFANVQERRREIGTLLAVGMTPRRIAGIFLAKALVLGLAGGIAGYVAGTALAVGLGPRIAEVPVLPLPGWLVWAVLVALAVTTAASAIPALRAARLDPAVTLRDL